MADGTRGSQAGFRAGRFGVLLAGLLLVAGSALAQAAGEGPARDAAPVPVPLDALLKLPAKTVTPSGPPEVGGLTRKQWEQRFDDARGAVRAAETRLAEAQAELEKVAAGSETWQVAAPGGSAQALETGPLSFGLRQQIRQARDDLEVARGALSELRVEANLAGVPADWMGEDVPPATP